LNRKTPVKVQTELFENNLYNVVLILSESERGDRIFLQPLRHGAMMTKELDFIKSMTYSDLLYIGKDIAFFKQKNLRDFKHKILQVTADYYLNCQLNFKRRKRLFSNIERSIEITDEMLSHLINRIQTNFSVTWIDETYYMIFSDETTIATYVDRKLLSKVRTLLKKITSSKFYTTSFSIHYFIDWGVKYIGERMIDKTLKDLVDLPKSDSIRPQNSYSLEKSANSTLDLARSLIQNALLQTNKITKSEVKASALTNDFSLSEEVFLRIQKE